MMVLMFVVPVNCHPSMISCLYQLVSTQLGALFEWTLPSQTVTPIGYQHDHGVSATLGNAHVYISDCKDAGICMLDTHINCSLRWRVMISRSRNCLRQFHGPISSAVHGMALPKLGIIDLPVLSFHAAESFILCAHHWTHIDNPEFLFMRSAGNQIQNRSV
jgi:hypothetical protein